MYRLTFGQAKWLYRMKDFEVLKGIDAELLKIFEPDFADKSPPMRKMQLRQIAICKFFSKVSI